MGGSQRNHNEGVGQSNEWLVAGRNRECKGGKWKGGDPRTSFRCPMKGRPLKRLRPHECQVGPSKRPSCH